MVEAAPSRAAPGRATRGGALLALAGGFVLSFDIPALRLGDGDPWSVLALRSVLIALIGLAVFGLRRWRRPAVPFLPGPTGRLVMLLYGLNGITFTLAIFTTTTASVVFILALNPLVTVLLAWVLIGERPTGRTLVAIAVTLVGVALILGGSVGEGRWLGNLLALATVLLLSSALTLTRRDGLDLSHAVLLAAALPAVVGGVVAFVRGWHIAAPGWIALDGLAIMPVAFFCLAVAPRFAPAALVAMAFLIETALAPVWVWLVLDEVPARITLIGGAIILAGVLLDAAGSWREGRAWTPGRREPEEGFR